MPHFMLIYNRFPAGCEGVLNGIAVKTASGNYIVWIDTEKDEATQAFTLRHELAHLHFRHHENEDCEGNERYEREANEYAARMTGDELKHLLSFCTGRKTLTEEDLTAFDRIGA